MGHRCVPLRPKRKKVERVKKKPDLQKEIKENDAQTVTTAGGQFITGLGVEVHIRDEAAEI